MERAINLHFGIMEIFIGEVDFYPGHGRTRAGQEKDIQVEDAAWRNRKVWHHSGILYKKDQKAIWSCEKLRSNQEF